MEKKEYLSEEKYQKTNNKIKSVGKLVGGVLIVIGVLLISYGAYKISEVSNDYSEASIALKVENVELQIEEKEEELDEEKNVIETKISELNAIIEPVQDQIDDLNNEHFTGFDDAYYDRKDSIEELEESIEDEEEEVYKLESVLDNSITCALNSNDTSEKYCDIIDEIDVLEGKISDLNSDIKVSIDKESEQAKNLVFIIPGIFITIIGTCILVSTIMITKRREIMAYGVQQVMPVAGESIEKMAPSIGKAIKTIKDEVEKK